MIKITKEEAMVIRQKAPNTHIAITNRQKPYKSYYMEESKEAMVVLRKMRGLPEPTPKKHRDNRHRGGNGWRTDSRN